jgi:squalene synthase HpnC
MFLKAIDMAETTDATPARHEARADLPHDAALALAPSRSVAQCEEFTRQLARSHYENFSIVSVLLPKRLTQDFCNVYAFCRVADDLGDEIHNQSRALAELDRLKEMTRACYAGEVGSVLFVALSATIKRHEIPIQPFLDLIDAFQQDQRMARYHTFDQLLDYCKRSADPVGRIVLYMCDHRDEERQKLSDLTCSALQLANFWQDVRRDLTDLDRIYLPAEDMQKFGVTEQQVREHRCDPNYRDLIRFQVDRTVEMFDLGEALIPLLDPGVRGHIALFGKGGRAILQAIRDCDYDTLSDRPALSGWQKGRLILSAVGAKLGISA